MYKRWSFIIGGVLGLGFVALISSAQVSVPHSDLYPGDQNKEVWNLQSTLRNQGVFDGPVTGIYDDDTVKAVTQLQTENGIEPTGEYTEDTIELLQEITDAGKSSEPTNPEGEYLAVNAITEPISRVNEKIASVLEGVSTLVSSDTKKIPNKDKIKIPEIVSPAVVLPECTDSQVRIYRDVSTLRLVTSGVQKMIAIGQIRIANYSECELHITSIRVFPMYSNQFDGDRFPFTNIDIIDAQASTVVGSALVQSVGGVTRITSTALTKLTIPPDTTNGFLLRLTKPTTSLLTGALGFGVGDISYTFVGAKTSETFVDRKIMWSNVFEIPQ